MARKSDPRAPARDLRDRARRLLRGDALGARDLARPVAPASAPAKGQEVDVSLYDSMLAMQTQEASMWMMRQEKLNWAAMPLTGVFDTKRRRRRARGGVQAESSPRHLHRARDRRPLGARAAVDDGRDARAPRRDPKDLPRALSRRDDGALDRASRSARPVVRAGALARRRARGSADERKRHAGRSPERGRRHAQDGRSTHPPLRRAVRAPPHATAPRRALGSDLRTSSATTPTPSPSCEEDGVLP